MNRRGFMALLGLSPATLLLKPKIPVGRNIQGQSADVVIFNEFPTKFEWKRGTVFEFTPNNLADTKILNAEYQRCRGQIIKKPNRANEV